GRGECRIAVSRIRVSGARALVYRYEPLQLLGPVLHDDDLRLRADTGFLLATADDQEPSIGGDVVRPSPTAPRERGEFEQYLRTPGDERCPGLHRDRKHRS